MSTTIRPEISDKNEYWIDKHRYYELKHFCLQYNTWKKAKEGLDIVIQKPMELVASVGKGYINKPVEKYVEASLYFAERIEMIESVAKETSLELWSYILKGVTGGLSYDYLKTNLNIPCCKDTYYKLYRRFFWLLDRARK